MRPITTLTKQFSTEAPVIQMAYELFFPNEQPHQYRKSAGYNVVVSSSEPLAENSFGHFLEDWFVFKYLVGEWRKERGATSSTSDIVLCYAYQSIIGMGSKAIPLILAQLESEGDDPDQWFWALQVLTRANPVAEEDEGNLRKMSRAWLKWATQNGYAR